MREHLESLIIALSRPSHRSASTGARPEPRRRRPRLARATYVPARRMLATPRVAT